MATKSRSFLIAATPATMFAHLVAAAIIALVLVWLLQFREGLSFTSENKQKIFNLHPLFMVIGFIIFFGEAIMVYKTIPGTRYTQKAFHFVFHFVALLSAIVGLYAVFQFHHDLGIPDIYTLHSWIGISTVSLFALQVSNAYAEDKEIPFQKTGPDWPVFFVFGYFSFWWPGAEFGARARLAPWHVFIGMVIFFMAIISAITGLLEKFTFLGLARSQEALIINFTGLLVLIFGISVGLTVLLPRTY